MPDDSALAVATVTKRIIVLISYDYLNADAVRAAMNAQLPAKFDIATKTGIGHTLLSAPNADSFDCSPIQWKPSWSLTTQSAAFDHALLFWDGHDDLLVPSVRFFEKRSIPFTILDSDAKVVAPAEFHATFPKEALMPTQSAVSAPNVIVDKPPLPPNYGNDSPTKNVKVRLQITVPEATAKVYEAQAKLVNIPLEKVMSDRLRTCVDHTSGRGLYFKDTERAHLEKITGGHLIPNAEVALSKIHTVVTLKVAGVDVELTERILARLASRAKSERKSFEDYVKKEVVMNLERSVGLRPW